jgi:hypothetical protein
MRFALVIGNNLPESSETPVLRYADDDALATHRLLLEAGVESTLLARLDRDTSHLQGEAVGYAPPRWRALEHAYAALVERMRAENRRGVSTELLLFYSGHGDVAGGEGYVMLEDARLTRTALYELLARSPATRNHVFIDACKSYFLAFQKGPGGTRAPYAGSPVAGDVPARLANTGFVLSTSSDRDSHEWERYQAGILSHELRSALRGAADADADGRVTYAELGAFLSAANHGIVNARFRPDFLVHPPEADLQREVLSWREDTSTLRLDRVAVGHMYIESPRGERLLDAHPDGRTSLTLHLPAQRPLFLRKDDDSTEDSITSLAPVQIAALTAATSEVAPRGALQLAFAQLFTKPFGSEDVAAFKAHDARDAMAPAPAPREASQHYNRLRIASGVVALGALAAGLSTSVVAIQKYASSENATQVEIARSNDQVRALNVGSLVCYGVALAAGVGWGFMTWQRHHVAASYPVARVGTRSVVLGVRTAF